MLAPINMITFIISLFLVDRQQRQWRLSQHAAGPDDSLWHRLTGLPSLDPQPYAPYQDPDSSAWQHDGRAADPPPIRTKHRAVARLSISDAFDMRGRVLVALIAGTSLGLTALFYAIRWLAS